MKFPREFPGKRNATKMASSEQSVFLVGNLTFKCLGKLGGNWTVWTLDSTQIVISVLIRRMQKVCVYVCVGVRQGG